MVLFKNPGVRLPFPPSERRSATHCQKSRYASQNVSGDRVLGDGPSFKEIAAGREAPAAA
jgi:hypothetical protein